jgi:hypothetical protein
MNYKYELEKYLNNSRSKLDSEISKLCVNNSSVASTQGGISESTILPSFKYKKVIEECLNFEEVDSRKVKFIYSVEL